MGLRILNEIAKLKEKENNIRNNVKKELENNPYDNKIIQAAYWDLDFTPKEIAYLTGRKEKAIQDIIPYKVIQENCRICNKEIILRFKKTEYKEYKKEVSGLYRKVRPWEYHRLCEDCREKQKNW